MILGKEKIVEYKDTSIIEESKQSLSGAGRVDVLWKITDRYGIEESGEEHRIFSREPTDGAEVMTGVGDTINMTNFESLRIDGWVKLPCNKEDIGLAFEIAWRIAAKEVATVTTKLRARWNKEKQVTGS
jgi:hypothetical protein